MYVHHFTEFIDQSMFDESWKNLDTLNKEYHKLANYEPDEVVQKYKPLF